MNYIYSHKRKKNVDYSVDINDDYILFFKFLEEALDGKQNRIVISKKETVTTSHGIDLLTLYRDKMLYSLNSRVHYGI